MGSTGVRGPRDLAQWTRGVAALALLLALAIGLGALVPKPLPSLAPPTVALARPHRIAPGHDIEAAGLARRIERLGYHRTRSPEPGIGEYFWSADRIAIHRPGFVGPDGPVDPMRFDLRLRRGGRVAQIRDEQGRELDGAWLEPETLGAIGDEVLIDRILVGLDDLPPHLVDAVLVTEDRRFREHGGLDLHRLGGALLANLRAKRVEQGGSTITQQLVKNVFLSQERTVARKLREAWLALRVERAHDKDEILTAYLNTIYLGQRGPVSVVGVEAAARHYFGRSARSLGLAESALIAGMIRGPGFYSPFTNPQRARERRNRVLAAMAEVGAISEAEAAAAAKRPLGNVSKPAGAPRPPWFLAKLERDIAGALPDADGPRIIFTGLDVELQLAAERAVRAGIGELEASFARLRKRESAPLQAALVALEPRSGAILAYVGGRRWSVSQFDRVAQAHRQPGSVFKPIVLLAALSRGADGAPAFTLASLLQDEPLEVATPQGPWRPANYEKEFRGAITLRRALEDSVNVPFARVGLALGPEAIVDVARRMGVESPLEPVPSLALGSGEVSPLEMARAYALLANGGERVEVRSAVTVLDAQGRPLLDLPPHREREFDPAEAALVRSALEGAVNHGTGHALREMGYGGAVAGKTGTTNEGRDAWFVGFTPDLVAAVWVGFDDGTPLGLTGARAALPIFGRFLIDAFGTRGGREFPEPVGLERIAIHERSGLRAGFLCWGRSEWFLSGTAPRRRCGPDWEATVERFEDPPRPDPERDRRSEPPHDPFDVLVEAFRGIVDGVAKGR